MLRRAVTLTTDRAPVKDEPLGIENAGGYAVPGDGTTGHVFRFSRAGMRPDDVVAVVMIGAVLRSALAAAMCRK